MAESPLNDHRSLSTASASSIDLNATNGRLTDASGNDVVLGTIEGDNEAEFGDADEGVREVKSGTPSGDLIIDSDGDIAVDGYGKVTLVGPYREVSTVGGTNGNSGSIYVNTNGNLQFDYTTWNSYDNLLQDSSDSNTKSITFDGSNYSWQSGLDREFTVTSGFIEIDQQNSGKEYTWGIEVEVDGDGDGTVDESSTDSATTVDDTTDYNFATNQHSIDSPFDTDIRVTVSPYLDGDNDGTEEYLHGPATDVDGFANRGINARVRYRVKEEESTTVSLY